MHPELVTLLRDHIERFSGGPGGRIFTGPRGGIIAEWGYLEAFHAARRQALTETEAATPLMGRPYDLRHAAVSTWLKAGVPAAQVAEWAGHSVDVLLRVYVKCIAGQQGEAKRRIEDAMRPLEGDEPGSTGQPLSLDRRDEEHAAPKNLDAYLPQTAAHSRYEPDTTAYGQTGTEQPRPCMLAGQRLFLLL